MSSRIFLITLFFSNSLMGQLKQCSCSLDSNKTKSTIQCKTTILKNGYKLYWQFNCGSIWLTLENEQNKKIVIDRVDTQFQNLTYRLGYRLVKEFKNSLLFSYSCPANGPCYYIILNKISGKIIKKIGSVINDPDKGYEFNFLAYLSKYNTRLKLYFPDQDKLIELPVNKNDFFYPNPNDQFDIIRIKKNIVTFDYEISRSQNKSVKKTIIIDINKYSR